MKYAKWLIIDAVLICVLLCVWHWYWETYMPSISDTQDEVIEEILFVEPPIEICEEVIIEAEKLPELSFPEHWGPEPNIQTRDYCKLPEPYGHGSSTLKHWIEKNQKEDANPPPEGPRAQEHLRSFNIPDTVPNRVIIPK